MQHEYKFMYILAGLDKDKVGKPKINSEEVNKIIINDEKEILYGNVKYFFM
jgi:hypothetical protein